MTELEKLALEHWFGGMSAVVNLALAAMPDDWATYADRERADASLRRRVRRIDADIVSKRWRIGRYTVGGRSFSGAPDPIPFEAPA